MSEPGKKPLILFFLVIFAGAMALGPLLYFVLGGYFRFHTMMDRALLLCAVAALFLYRSSMPLRELWPLDDTAWKQLLYGWAVALVSGQAMLGANLACAGFTSNHLSGGAIAYRLLLALVAALIVPLLEETVFRGFLQTELIGRLGVRAGWLLAAVIFALAHFIKIPTELDHQPVHLWSGITAIGAAFGPVGQGLFLSGKGLNIFLIGLILGATFLRCGTLWFNAGLHGGWIFTYLLFSGLTRPDDPPIVPWLRGDLLSNPVTSVVLIVLSLWLWKFYQPYFTEPETGASAS